METTGVGRECVRVCGCVLCFTHCVCFLSPCQVRMGNLKNNRSQSLYPTGSLCIAIACRSDPPHRLAGWLEGGREGEGECVSE